MNLFELNAELRSDMGKGASRRLRREADKIPAIVYGGDKAPQPLSLDHKEVLQHVEHEAFYSHILTLIIDGKKNKVILKDMQRHPFKPKVTHMDFQRVSDNAEIHMQVPLHFINEEACAGAKAGGLVQHNMNTVEVICKAKDLPEFIEVDMTEVGLGEVVHLSNLNLPKGVQLADLTHGDDHDHTVVAVHRRGGAAEASDDSEEASEE